MEVIATNLELYRAIPVDYLLDLKLQFARHFVCRFKVQQVDDVTYTPAEVGIKSYLLMHSVNYPVMTVPLIL